MMRVLTLVLFVLGLSLPALVPVVAQAQDRIEVAQQQKKRTLFDLLFGSDDKPAAEAPRTTRKPAASSTRKAALPPAVPTPNVEKALDATRLAVFGDSLAVDLAKAMERFYAEDPNLVIIGQGVGSSGFVRDDFFDWDKALRDAIAADSFDIAVVAMGINDRQNLRVDGTSVKPLTDEWKVAYSARLNGFLEQLRLAGKPVIWVELPPMEAPSYGSAMTQISSLQRLAAFSAGAEYVETFDRFADEAGNYVANGPDLNGQNVLMRKKDGIHFSSAGSDKLAFFINQSLKRFYRGGTISVAVVDPLANTDAASMVRLPFQGLGQVRLLEVAGAVIPLKSITRRAGDLLIAEPGAGVSAGFSLDEMVKAPVGRADAFGVGVDLSQSATSGAAD